MILLLMKVKKHTLTDEGEETYINRAIVAASSYKTTSLEASACSSAVELENRVYILKGAITFPSFPYGEAYDSHYKGFTFISPGTLKLVKDNKDNAAIRVKNHFVNLVVNKIEGYVEALTPGPNPSVSYGGTGIELVDDCSHVSIDVKLINGVNKGIAIMPATQESVDDKGNIVLIGSGVQYTRIRFEFISNAKYGIFVDIYSGNREIESGKLNTWFNENEIEGGQIGNNSKYGVYFVDRPAHLGSDKIGGQNSLIFRNIGFEGLTDTPLRISNVSGGKFLDLRMAESLPGITDKNSFYPWIELKDVEFSEISLRGILTPTHIKIVEGSSCRGVVFNSWILDNPDSWSATRFNRMVAMPMRDPNGGEDFKYVLTAYSSIVPFNMGQTIVGGGEAKVYNLGEILPLNFKFTKPQGKPDPKPNTSPSLLKGYDIAKFNVLPNTLNVVMDEDSEKVTLNLTGLSRFAPSVFDICLQSNGNKELELLTKVAPDYLITASDPAMKVKSLSLSKPGLYRLTWDADWNLIVSGVTI